MSSAAVTEHGFGQWEMKVLWLDADELVPNAANPNQQDDRTFNALVAAIRTEGWTQPVQAVFDEARGKYEIVAGEHRWRAGRVLGSKIPTLPLPPAEFDRDRRDWIMVKDNILSGELNPQKFADLYQRMVKTYDAEVLQTLMGFTSEDAFKKLYREVKAGLSPEMQAALEASRDEIRSIDDLSTVLNRLFRDFGETLDSNFMVFSYGGRDVLWVRADKALWGVVKAMSEAAEADGADLAELFKGRLG